MKACAYYNEIDPRVAAWLRELIKDGHIAAGEVDERSIVDVKETDLNGFKQVHLFAGIGGWARALRLARWPDGRPVWSGSCPCPPFSCAGKGQLCPDCQGRDVVPHPYKTGVFVCVLCGKEWYADGRHLYPEFRRLLEHHLPPAVFGEQVASADGRVWLAGVRVTLEQLGYAVGGADLCAAGVGAPHIRQRLFWVAYRDSGRVAQPDQQHDHGAGSFSGDDGGERKEQEALLGERGDPSGVADTDSTGRAQQSKPFAKEKEQSVAECDGGSGNSRLEHALCERREGEPLTMLGPAGEGYWTPYEWLPCRDGKSRRVKPGLRLLAHGVPARVVRLRGYGNAIVPSLASEFIQAAEEAIAEINNAAPGRPQLGAAQ